MKHLVIQPNGDLRLGDELLHQLRDRRWTSFRAAVAFVKASGVKHVAAALEELSRRADVRMLVGVDLGGTSREGLEALLDAVGARGRIAVFHDETRCTFHPKVFLFRNETHAVLITGSGNLTDGGLFRNYEIALSVGLDLGNEEDAAVLRSAETALDAWEQGPVLPLTNETLLELQANGYLGPESAPAAERTLFEMGRKTLFPRVEVARIRTTSVVEAPRSFVMTLQRTDVGYGQVTPGTSRRSAEIFIPLIARDFAPAFWGWPDAFSEDARKYTRPDVRMRMGDQTISVNMFGWKRKRDFRLRNEVLRSAGKIGDVLRLERAPAGADFDYYAEVVPQESREYETYRALCTRSTGKRNSKKLWGYA